MLLYEKAESSPTAKAFNVFSFPEKRDNILLKIGTEVIPIIISAERNKTIEPMNIQNSLDEVSSSLGINGIFFHRLISNAKAGTVNIKNKIRKCHLVMPSPVNACTDVSCKSPLLVK